MSARKKISASLARTCSLAGTCWACGHLSLAVLVALAAGIAGLAPAQDTLLYSVRGSERDEDLGISVAGLGDVDGDRAPDFVAGAEGYPWAEDRGRVLLVSGRTGAVLREWVGVEAHIGFGGAVSAAGDLDGDGITDFAAVDHREGLTITIISPRSGEAILKISAGIRPFTAAYPILAEPFDADGDATPDLALGDSGYVIGGRISVYSGKTGHEIWTRKGNKAFDGLGFSLALIGDLDGDGRRDLAAGKPGSSHAVWEDSQTPGEVVILSGADGSILRALPGPPRHFNFGEAVANAGDLDGDGLPELAIAAPGYAGPSGFSRGWVGIYSTRTFEVLREYVGNNSYIFNRNFQGDALGFKLSPAGDADGDRVPDLLIAAERWSSDFGYPGRIDLRSGRTGALLAAYEVEQEDERFLGSLAPLGDVDGDGRDEFLVGAWNYPPRAPSCAPPNCTGAVLALRFPAERPLFLRGDANGDGQVDLSDVVALIEILHLGRPIGGCPLALDVNGNDQLTTADYLALFRYLFLGNLAPAPPFPDCGRYGGLRKPAFECQESQCAQE